MRTAQSDIFYYIFCVSCVSDTLNVEKMAQQINLAETSQFLSKFKSTQMPTTILIGILDTKYLMMEKLLQEQPELSQALLKRAIPFLANGVIDQFSIRRCPSLTTLFCDPFLNTLLSAQLLHQYTSLPDRHSTLKVRKKSDIKAAVTLMYGRDNFVDDF